MPTSKLFFLPLLTLLLLGGCKEEFPTYSQTFSLQPECLDYSLLDTKDQDLIKKAFSIPAHTNCPYKVSLLRYHVGECNNPLVKSLGSDFNGYIRIEVKKGFDSYYKVQSDFKEDENAAFERVLKQIEKEKWQKDSN